MVAHVERNVMLLLLAVAILNLKRDTLISRKT